MIMVKTTYALTPDDQEKLISYASRYRSIRTIIDETNHTMTVSTTFLDNVEPTSGAETFKLQVVSADPPTMPDVEFRRRMKGEPV
jgi:phosphopantetheine adenylyltransferase